MYETFSVITYGYFTLESCDVKITCCSGLPYHKLTRLSGCYIFRHYLCSVSSLVDLHDDRTRGSQEICDTSGVSTIIPVLYTLKCGVSLLEVWFHLCILFIFICVSLHLSSYTYLLESLQHVMHSSRNWFALFGS